MEDKKKKTVIVVTFVWREMLSMEKMAFECGLSRLGQYPFAVVHPIRFSIEKIKRKYPQLIDIPMDNHFFESVNTYNEMMLMPEFYYQFQKYDFMLIYQLDAFVFRDELMYWVEQDYDYIGAPWLPSDSLYQRTIGEIIIRLKKLFPIKKFRITHAQKYFEVGNGGFSLRKISTMIRLLSENRSLIDAIPKGSRARQEDIAISVVLSKKTSIRIPNWRIAAHFSFCDNPNRCFRVTKGKIPFGCHAWDTSNWEKFWRGKLWFGNS